MNEISRSRLSFPLVSIVLGMLGSSPAWAIQADCQTNSQANSRANCEDEYFQEYTQKVLPNYYRGESGTFLGKDGIQIAYRKFQVEPEQNEAGALVILPGQGEPMLKYAEVIYDLKDLNFSVYIMEHRGQGESGLIDGVSIQFVRSYREYVTDLSTFMTIVNQRAHAKRFLLAHSMGAAIGALYAQGVPKAFDAAVFSSPMFDMYTPGYPRALAYPLAWTACNILRLGKCTAGTNSAQLTSSKIRENMLKRVDSEFPGRNPKQISFQWGLASLKAIRGLQKRSASFELPFLMLQAEKDRHVPAAGQDRFYANSPRGEKYVLRDSFHEGLMEVDFIRNQALNEIRSFFAKF